MTFERDYGRYMVIKRDDLLSYLTTWERTALFGYLKLVENGRVGDEKKPYHDYICVRQDAPYAESVWNLIQADIGAREAQ